MTSARFAASVVSGAFIAAQGSLAWAADNKGEFKLQALDFQIGTKDSKLKSTIAYDSDGTSLHGGVVLGLTFKAPLNDVEDTAQARLDDLGTGWRAGLSVGKEWQWSCQPAPEPGSDERGPSPDWSSFLGIEGLYGPQKFNFYPDGGAAKKSVFTHSFDTSLSGYVHHTPKGSATWALQGKVGYAKDWKASDKAGIVGDDGLVRTQKVVDAPSAETTLLARAFFYRPWAAGSPLAFGPTLAYSAESKSKIGRLELWVFYLPLGAPANLRVGVAPFVDAYFAGKNKDGNQLEPGLLFQVKFGDPIFLY